MAWKKHLWCWLDYFWWRSLLFSDCWSSDCHRPGATSGSELFIAVLLRKSLPVSFCNRMYLIRLPSPILHTFIPRHVWRQDQRSSSPRILWGNFFREKKSTKSIRINKNPCCFSTRPWAWMFGMHGPSSSCWMRMVVVQWRLRHDGLKKYWKTGGSKEGGSIGPKKN